jgi:hypothetical protein
MLSTLMSLPFLTQSGAGLQGYAATQQTSEMLHPGSMDTWCPPEHSSEVAPNLIVSYEGSFSRERGS